MFFHLNVCKWKSVITYTILNPEHTFEDTLYGNALPHFGS